MKISIKEWLNKLLRDGKIKSWEQVYGEKKKFVIEFN